MSSRAIRTLFISGCLAGAISAQDQVKISTTISNLGQGRSMTSVSGGPSYDANRVLVRFRNAAAKVLLPGSGAVRGFPGDANLFLVHNPAGVSVRETLARYKADPNVHYAEPDYVLQAIFIPNDTLVASQWDMTKISAPTVWDN